MDELRLPSKRKQFTLWQLMKAVAIAAGITIVVMPFIRKLDEILERPGIFIAVMVLVFLIQAPMLFLASLIDWIFGVKPRKQDKNSTD